MAVNVKMGVDVGAFTSGINDGKRVLAGLKAEMKATEAEFKATGNAETMLANKTKTLNSQINIQKSIADQAAQALKAMADSGVAPTDAAYQRLYVTMMNANAGMNTAQAELNALSSGAQSAAGSADQLSSSMQSIGQKLSLDQVISGIDSITGAMENAASKAIDFGQKLWDTIMDSARRADDTATMADMYNIPLKEFLQMQKLVGDGMDTSVDAMLSSMTKLKRGIGNESEAAIGYLKEFGLVVSTGKFGDVDKFVTEDSLDLFFRAGQAIMSMGDGIEAEAKQEAAAQALFGRSWKELSDLFDRYENVEEYRKALEETSTSSEDSVRNLAQLNDAVSKLEGTWGEFKTELLGAIAGPLAQAATSLEGLLATLLEYLQTEEGKKALDDLGKAVEGLFSNLSEIDPEQVVSGFAQIFDGIIQGMQWLSENKDTLIGVMTGLVAAWGGLKLTGGLLQLWQLIMGLKNLGGNPMIPTSPSIPTNGNTPPPSTGTPAPSGGDVGTGAAVGGGFMSALLPNLAIGAGILGQGILAGGSLFGLYKAFNGFLFGTGEDPEADANEALMRQDIAEHGGMYDEPVEIPAEVKPETSADDISEAVGTVTLNAELRVGGGRNFLDGGAGAGGSHGIVVMSHANGLPFVPYDGYLASLHKGERVMPAREVQSRSYNSNLYVESMYMNNGTDAEGLAAAMAAAQRRTLNGYGS